ncbi:MAG: hypothetical protein B7X77_02705, partial [Caulobacter sp. 39-67-4]
TVKAATQVERQLEKYRADGVAERTVISVPRFGQSQFNTANGVLVLNSAGDRKQSADQIAAELNKTLSKITGVRAVASVRGAFQRGGGGGNSVDLIAVGNDYVELANWLKPILAEAQANPGLSRPRIDYEPTSPRLSVQIDRDKAGTLGVSAQSIGRALETMFGSRRATTYIKNGQEYDVILQSTLEQRRSIADLDQLQVRTQSGALVPLSTVVTTELRGDTPDRPRVDRLRSVTLTTQLAEGYTVADAVAFLQEQAEARPTPGVSIKWGGQAKDYLEASGAVGVAFGLALLLVFLVLAAQFESWIHPAVIMLTVPLAVLGGLFGLLITGSSINTYSQIGLIILVGIAATLDRAEQLSMIDLNMRALTELSLAFVDAMARQHGGLLNVGSIAGFLPGPGSAVYYASKAYVLSFSEALHSELRARGIKVTVLCPGPVPTEFAARAGVTG